MKTLYKRLYIAYLLSKGVNTVPKLIAETGMSRSTVQDVINDLIKTFDMAIIFVGAAKNGNYVIDSWGAINREWVVKNIDKIEEVTLSKK